MGTRDLVGVLALQGDFAEHLTALARLGVPARAVRRPEELAGLRGLILPGGESTTIGKLMRRFQLVPAIERFAREGGALLGTCAGMILLAKDIVASDQFRLGVMDILVERNAYGRQVESFEVSLEAPALGEEPFRGVFIRAPRIHAVGEGVEVLARHVGEPVFVRQGAAVATSFHPELTDDLRLHAYFLRLVEER